MYPNPIQNPLPGQYPPQTQMPGQYPMMGPMQGQGMMGQPSWNPAPGPGNNSPAASPAMGGPQQSGGLMEYLLSLAQANGAAREIPTPQPAQQPMAPQAQPQNAMVPGSPRGPVQPGGLWAALGSKSPLNPGGYGGGMPGMMG